MAKRFRLYSGYVRSLSDGQEHFVSGAKLAELYGINPAECVIVTGSPHEVIDNELIPLFPLADGRYKQHLEQMKVDDFWRYVKARKLLVHHTSGSSPRCGPLRGDLEERPRKSIAWHEKHWPDFPAAYKRYEERNR